MHIHDVFARASGPTLSLEFFPPKSPEAERTLQESLTALEPLEPAFVSVTYGAGGSTRDLTEGLVKRLRQHAAWNPIPHLTCIGHRESEVMALLTRYAAAGVSNILALRGDLPAGQTGGTGGDFAQAADLVRFIKRFNEQGIHPDARGFGIGVACYPEGHPATPNRLLEMDHLKAKVDAGADYLCTQAFFDNHDFHDFRERCALAGIDAPVVAGVLPLSSAGMMKRMAGLISGARYPARLIKALRRTDEDAESFRKAALHHAAEQCADLLHHDVDGVHFYTLNQSGPVGDIMQRTGWSKKPRLQIEGGCRKVACAAVRAWP